jgi:putative ABC transport system permease protein
VLAVFAVLIGLARAGAGLMRRVAPGLLNFAWRQGLANLYRPNNQTAAVTLAIGLGTFLLVMIASVQSMLIGRVAALGSEGESNLVLFDVQPDQRGRVRELMSSLAVGVQAEVPIVTMRLSAVKGRSVAALRADPAAGIPGWALRREYRSTYRSELSGTEKIVKGTWEGKVAAGGEPVPVSVEKGMAEALKVGLGDELRFEIQGVPIVTRIASVREVDWQRLQPNFFVVFPEGAIDDAPKFFALVGRAGSPQASAELERAIVERFPNVSAIDLRLILDTVNAILAKVAAAIRGVALFILATGFAVLAGAVIGSRAQRVRESILLRTLGAPRSQILRTLVAEYLFLGAIAGVAGALLGMGATWGLAEYFFGAPARIAMTPVALILLAVIGVTVVTGVVGSLKIFYRSPLEALRAEA